MSAAERAVTVEPVHAGLRLDTFLARTGMVASAQGARRLLDQGLVRVDGQRAKKGMRLQAGQRVAVAEVPAAADVPAMPLSVLHLDGDLVAINKPAGWPSVGQRPGERGTAAAALAAEVSGCATAGPSPEEGGLVQRLDTGTSGVLIAARSPEMWRALRTGALQQKDYVAEIVPTSNTGAFTGRRVGETARVEAAIGRVGRQSPRVEIERGRSLQPARTDVVVTHAFSTTSLVRATLAQGRPHQVRAHLAHVGAPIVGDALYGTPETQAVARALGLAEGAFHLHAVAVVLTHPRTGAQVRITAPLPDWALRQS